MVTAFTLAYHIDRLRRSGASTLVPVVLVLVLVLSIAAVAIAVLLQPASETILAAPLRWYS